MHHQSIFSNEYRLNAEYAFANRWAVSAMLPLRLIRTRIEYTDLDGNPITLDYENIHHRNETLFGLADPWLLGQHARKFGRAAMDVRAGVSLPLGNTEENPYVLAEEGESHEHVQFGTGTFNPILGASLGYDLRSWFPMWFFLAQIVLYENGHGYRGGNRFASGLFASSSLGLERWRFRLGPEVQAETAESWDGTAHELDGNRGRVDVLGTAGASFGFAPAWRIAATARVPLYTHAVGGRLDYPVILELGLTRTFELSSQN